MTDVVVSAGQSRAARIAGTMYLTTLVPAVFAQFYVHGSLVVPDDATRTAKNIIEHERLFRIGIASDLIAFTGVVVLILALYVLLKPVNGKLAMLGALWRFAEVVILCVVALGSIIAVALLSGADYLKTFDADQLHSLARLALGARGAGYNLGMIPFGLGSALFSYLLLKSRYVPAALAAWGIFSSLLVVTSAFWFIVLPESATAARFASYAALFVYEITLGFWLLVKGVKVK